MWFFLSMEFFFFRLWLKLEFFRFLIWAGVGILLKFIYGSIFLFFLVSSLRSCLVLGKNEKRKVLHKMSVINSCYGTAKNSLTNE